MNRIVALGVALLATTTLSPAAHAILLAPDQFTFTGDCSDCERATATLLNYGTTLNYNSFFSFTYSSSVISYTITKATVSQSSVFGDLSGAPGRKAVTILGYDPMSGVSYSFVSQLSGRFDVEELTPLDFGPDHSWAGANAAADAPEPASWAMMVGGFALVGGAMRRRVRTTVTYA